ncbi:hypothetical protein HDU97_002760 [Phlyctochytrium planicorne]|nr:hypothetical protein HDU97_002760 [Phlyctochytrium planicorne]
MVPSRIQDLLNPTNSSTSGLDEKMMEKAFSVAHVAVVTVSTTSGLGLMDDDDIAASDVKKTEAAIAAHEAQARKHAKAAAEAGANRDAILKAAGISDSNLEEEVPEKAIAAATEFVFKTVKERLKRARSGKSKEDALGSATPEVDPNNRQKKARMELDPANDGGGLQALAMASASISPSITNSSTHMQPNHNQIPQHQQQHRPMAHPHTHQRHHQPQQQQHTMIPMVTIAKPMPMTNTSQNPMMSMPMDISMQSPLMHQGNAMDSANRVVLSPYVNGNSPTSATTNVMIGGDDVTGNNANDSMAVDSSSAINGNMPTTPSSMEGSSATPSAAPPAPGKATKRASKPKKKAGTSTTPGTNVDSDSIVISKVPQKRRRWDISELEALEEGMKVHGTHWAGLLSDAAFKDRLAGRGQMQLKDKAATEKERRIKTSRRIYGRDPTDEELGVWRFACDRKRVVMPGDPEGGAVSGAA